MQLHSRIVFLWDKSGVTFLVAYLKECTRLLQHYISGMPDKSTVGAFVRVSRSGIPMIIPAGLRKDIALRNAAVIRGVLTVLSVYRVLNTPPKLKIESITDPFNGVNPMLPETEVALAWKKLNAGVGLASSVSPFIINKAGPNVAPSWLSLFNDGIALRTNPELLSAFTTLCNLTRSGDKLHQHLMDLRIHEIKILQDMKLFPTSLRLGKLAKKFEAAGKVRVFAITDWWTQMILKPLHDSIFSILKRIRQDGTFNQSAPLTLLQEITRGTRTVYSFDLSSATDRLPMELQVQILTLWLGSEYAQAWKTLLINRDWWLGEQPVRYAVGQPMGAYSSWAMLALTHHLIVQIAARRVGWSDGWFPYYAVLGDDVVIADEAVAASYLSIMRDLGVGINMSKSLVSNLGIFEYAKRLTSPHAEYTPVGPGNILLSLRNWNTVPLLFLDLFQKGCLYDVQTVLNMLSSVSQWGPKGLSVKNVNLLKLVMVMPGGYLMQWRKEAGVSNFHLGNFSAVAAGRDSAHFIAWVWALEGQLKALSYPYLDRLSIDLKKKLSHFASLRIVEKIKRPLTDLETESLISFFDECPNPLTPLLEADKKEKGDWKRMSLLRNGFWPGDHRSVNISDWLATNTNRLETFPDENFLISKWMRNREIGSLLNFDQLDSSEVRTFAKRALYLRTAYRRNLRHMARVRRSDLPMVIVDQGTL